MKINQSMFLQLIHTLCTLYPASVTSWIRTPANNQKNGGRPNSRHLLGMAVDVVCDDTADTAALAKAAQRLGLDAVIESDHIHIEADSRTD